MRSLWDEFTSEATFTPYPGVPFSESLLTDQVALVAEHEGLPVGCVYIALSDENFGYVFGLYVRLDARRRGLGSRLMREVALLLQREGRRYIVLSVDTPNHAGRSLYEHLGFVDAAAHSEPRSTTSSSDIKERKRDTGERMDALSGALIGHKRAQTASRRLRRCQLRQQRAPSSGAFLSCGAGIRTPTS
jgi:GNAT superfamily N-acetyltransferase